MITAFHPQDCKLILTFLIAVINQVNYNTIKNENKIMDEKIKQFYASKTFWLNAISILIAVIALASQSFPLNPEWVAFIVGVGNLLLRFIEGKPIMVGSKKFGRE